MTWQDEALSSAPRRSEEATEVSSSPRSRERSASDVRKESSTIGVSGFPYVGVISLENQPVLKLIESLERLAETLERHLERNARARPLPYEEIGDRPLHQLVERFRSCFGSGQANLWQAI